MFPLEHFYYGQLVHHGRPTGEMRVLARSAGVTEEHISAAIRGALLPPLAGSAEGTIAVLRGGKGLPYFIVQSQMGNAGQTTLHVILMPVDVWRGLGGNLEVLQLLIKKNLPTFDRLGDALVPLGLVAPSAPDTATQVDQLLEMMTSLRNNTRSIETMLGAVVQNVPLVIINAPLEMAPRLNVIQGLLTCLPSSTRFGVTFATHLDENTRVQAQISFMTGRTPPNCCIYDWQSASFRGEEVRDDYSRFIISQLRLDAELVIQQAELLTPVAGWRYRSGDNLSEALSYSSYRAKLDHALITNMPVEALDVSRVLSEDPTLDDTMRSIYAEHLLKFSIALDNMDHADPIAANMANSPQLARTVHKQFSAAIEAGKGPLIFQTMVRWMSNPLSPQGPEWISLTHEAALAELDSLVADHDIPSINDYLDDLQSLDASLLIGRIAPRIVGALLPLTAEDEDLAARLLLLSMTYLDPERFKRLLSVRHFAQKLPRPMRRFLAALDTPDNPALNESGILLAAAASFGEKHYEQAVLRLSEMAFSIGRTQLFDTPVLKALLAMSMTPQGPLYATLLVDIARRVNDTHLHTLEEPGARVVLQIMLACRRYDMLANTMAQQSRDYYGGERQLDYVRMVQALFAETPLPVADLRRALAELNSYGVKGIPLAVAGCGALESSQWSPEMNDIAEKAIIEISQSSHYLEVLHPEVMSALLRHYIAQKDANSCDHVAEMLAINAAFKDPRTSLNTLLDAYKHLNEEASLRPVALEMLRVFVRTADPSTAQRAIRHFSKEIGSKATRKLEMAFAFSNMMMRTNLASYAEELHIAANLLQNNYESYIQSATQPPLGELLELNSQIRTTLDMEERDNLSQNLRKVAKAIILLGEDHKARSGGGTKQLQGVARGQEEPKSTLEVLRCAGGFLAKGRMVRTQLTPNTRLNPFRGLTTKEMEQHIHITADILQALYQAYPSGQPLKWTRNEIIDEVKSNLHSLPQSQARDIVARLASDWQRIADMVIMILRDSDPSAVEASGRLAERIESRRYQPASVLEMYRFVYGNFISE